MRSTEELARHAKADSLSFGIWHFDTEALERFAALVRAQVLEEAAMTTKAAAAAIRAAQGATP